MNKNLSPYMILLLAQKSQQGKTILKQMEILWLKLEKLMNKESK
jgi:hypothetical protein